MKSNRILLFFLMWGALAATSAQGAFLVEVDTDMLDDAVLTYSPNFSFGAGTTTASQSAKSNAVGMTGGDSIFGGDADATLGNFDTYQVHYSPAVDGDNLTLAAGTPLNAAGNKATGETAGGTGRYRVYATWPFTANVSGGDTTFTLASAGGTVASAVIDQNGGRAGGSGNEWIRLFDATLDAGTAYTLTQVAADNTFVSMRLAGVLFDVSVPEPSSLALGTIVIGLAALRRRS